MNPAKHGIRTNLWLVLALALAGISPRCASAVDLLSENFDQLALSPVQTLQSEVRSRRAWTASAPSGAGVEGLWAVDNAAMPPATTSSNLIGVAEFEGWTFVDKQWWIDTADNQGRADFVSASGTIAVADPDEWDDFGSPNSPASYGNFDSTLRISNIPLQGIAPNTARLFFHSSWRFEDFQKASLVVKYNDSLATTRTLLDWDSVDTSLAFHDDATNEAIDLNLMNPAGATTATLEFRLHNAGNDWWWAIDNLNMFTGASPAQDGALRLIVNRDTGQVKIVNNTAGTVNLRGYTVNSTAGTLIESAAAFLGDTNANWKTFDNPAASELSEGYIPDQYAMPTQAANSALGVIDFGNTWEKYHIDISDVTFQYLVAGNDMPQSGIVEFIGNDGESFSPLDLNFDGQVSLGDYSTFLANYSSSLTGKTSAQRYNLGDLNRDGLHTIRDFAQFRRDFNALRGPGALEAAIAASSIVPEPTTLASAAILALALIAPRRRKAVIASAVILLGSFQGAPATGAPLNENFDGIPLFPSVEEAPTAGVWSDVGPVGWKIDRTGVPGYSDPNANGVKEWAGWNFAKKDWWVSAAGDQNRGQFTSGTGTVLVADPDEWDDAAHPKNSYYNTYITTPRLDVLSGVAAGQVRMTFNSSWRPEGFDDWILPGQTYATNNQTATVEVSFNEGPFQTVMKWDSDNGHTNQGPADPIPTRPPSPFYHPDATNEAVDVSLAFDGTPNTSIKVRIGLTNAANDWWWALDNIQVSNVDVILPVPPTLRVNTTTGVAELVGGGLIPEAITGYEITSVNGSLAPSGNIGLSFTKPDSVDGPDLDTTVGNSIGESWQLAAATSNQFSEFFLDGMSTYSAGRVDSLGHIFNPATPAGQRDLQFSYSTLDGTISVPVEYVSTSGNADFDGNGIVNGADLLRWQRGVGSGTTAAQGDADADGDVDTIDLSIWKAQFGSSPATAAKAAVPEPAGAMVATCGLAALLAASRRRYRAVCLTFAAALPAIMLVGGGRECGAQVIPPPFVDRNYRMGDGDPSAANGVAVTITRDDAGLPLMNQLIDMTAQTRAGGAAQYITISGRPDGVGGLGIRLNPNAADKQYLRTGADQALNYPARSPSSTEGTLPGGTLDYEFITDRGFQLWVQPFAATEGQIVMDSNNHGALINAQGKFGMRYSGFDYSGTTTVIPNTWYHLEVVRAFGDRGTGSVLYVNGVAEAAATGIYFGEDRPNDEMNAANQDNSPLVIGSTTSESPFSIGTQKYYRGVVDDLTMFVMGFNTTSDRGEFSFQRDNAYAAHFGPSVPGDLNGDNAISLADVNVFAANWQFENKLQWLQAGNSQSLVVGDLGTRARGDFNYDGRVNLADWGILNTANPAMGAAALALIDAVPEPASITLALIVLAAGAGGRRRGAHEPRTRCEASLLLRHFN